MKKMVLSAFACFMLAGTMNAADAEKKQIIKFGEVKSELLKFENVDPIKCTGTLTIWQGATIINVKVVFNNDITTDADCEKWVGGKADDLQKELGSSYQVKKSYSFVK